MHDRVQAFHHPRNFQSEIGTDRAGVDDSHSPRVSSTEKGFDEGGEAAPTPAARALRGHPRQLQAAGACLLQPLRLLPVPLLRQRLFLPRAQPPLLSAPGPRRGAAGTRLPRSRGRCWAWGSLTDVAFRNSVRAWPRGGRGYRGWRGAFRRRGFKEKGLSLKPEYSI